MRPLTAKQEAFAVAVAAGATGADAYRKAYAVKRMTAKSIHENASRLLADGKVASRVATLRAPATAKAQELVTVNEERVLFEDAKVGFSDVRRLFHPDGRMKAPHEWDADTAGAVAGIKVRTLYGEGKDGLGAIGTITEVKLWNKGDALDRLNRRFGAYKKDNEQKEDALTALERGMLKVIEERLLGLSNGPTGMARPALAGSAATPTE